MGMASGKEGSPVGAGTQASGMWQSGRGTTSWHLLTKLEGLGPEPHPSFPCPRINLEDVWHVLGMFLARVGQALALLSCGSDFTLLFSFMNLHMIPYLLLSLPHSDLNQEQLVV